MQVLQFPRQLILLYKRDSNCLIYYIIMEINKLRLQLKAIFISEHSNGRFFPYTHYFNHFIDKFLIIIFFQCLLYPVHYLSKIFEVAFYDGPVAFYYDIVHHVEI